MIHIFKHEVQKDTDNVVKKQALIIGVVPVLKDVWTTFLEDILIEDVDITDVEGGIFDIFWKVGIVKNFYEEKEVPNDNNKNKGLVYSKLVGKNKEEDKLKLGDIKKVQV